MYFFSLLHRKCSSQFICPNQVNKQQNNIIYDVTLLKYKQMKLKFMIAL